LIRCSSSGFAWQQLHAELDAVERGRQFVLSNASQVHVPADTLNRIAVVLEEVLMNIIRYAYAEEQRGLIEVGCGLAQEGLFCVTIRDKGKAFNPLLLHTPDITIGIEERKIGGLGIHLIRQLADNIDYQRSGGWNEVTCCFK